MQNEPCLTNSLVLSQLPFRHIFAASHFRTNLLRIGLGKQVGSTNDNLPTKPRDPSTMNKSLAFSKGRVRFVKLAKPCHLGPVADENEPGLPEDFRRNPGLPPGPET